MSGRHLIINATQVTRQMSGLGIHAKNITEGLLKRFETGTVYTQHDCFSSVNPKWDVREVGFVAKDSVRTGWMQTVFPCRIPRDAVLYSPNIESPAFIRNRFIIVIHDLIPLRMPELHTFKLKLYYKKIVPVLLRKAAYVVCISESTKKELVRFYPSVDESKLRVIYDGYDRSLFNTGTSDGAVESFKKKYGLGDYLLYVGRISKTKNLLTLLKAFRKILAETNNNLLIVGKNEYDNKNGLVEYIKKENFADRVRFVDYLEDDELVAAYAGAGMFILPSFYEGFGLPLVEAMACGVPVIVSDTDTLLEVTEGSGLSFRRDDSDDLAGKILELLNPETNSEFRRKSLERAKKFDWNIASDKTADLIGSLM